MHLRLAGLLLVSSLPLATGSSAHAAPPCISTVGASTTKMFQAADVTIHGFGGGSIGSVAFPTVPGVTPTKTTLEADVVAVPVSLHFLGLYGGATTVMQSVLATGPAATLSGAQNFDASSFTGHMKLAVRTLTCVSQVTGQLFTFTYNEVWLTGLKTPTSASSPLADWGEATQAKVTPGDTSSR